MYVAFQFGLGPMMTYDYIMWDVDQQNEFWHILKDISACSNIRLITKNT